MLILTIIYIIGMLLATITVKLMIMVSELYEKNTQKITSEQMLLLISLSWITVLAMMITLLLTSYNLYKELK